MRVYESNNQPTIFNKFKACCIPRNEDERMAALTQLQILHSAPEEDFDNIAELAAHICETPISIIAFLDKASWWIKAKVGLDEDEIPREYSFCESNWQEDNMTIVTDTFADPRFFNNPLVTKDPGVRFYVVLPLKTEDGITLGHLCVMDQKVRTLSTKQLSALRTLGKQIEKLLKQRLQKIKEEAEKVAARKEAIFQNGFDAVVVMDCNGTMMQLNEKAENVFGWASEEAIGQSFIDTIIAQPNRMQYWGQIEHYKLTGDEESLNATAEVSAVCKDHVEINIALGISPSIIKGQLFFICFIRDITDRKLVRSKLDKQKEFYETILNKIPTDIAVFDPQHKYLFVNPGAIKNEELRKFIIGKDDFEYAEYRNRDKAVAEVRREKFLEVKNSKKEIRWEDSLKDAEGNTVTHLRRLFPVLDEKGELTMVIGFGIDITDINARKLMEEKQTALVNQLSSQNKQLVDFCNIVSHNLRAPLVNMSMLVKYIEENEDPDEQRVMISMLNPVIENLNTTFNELVESIQIKNDLEIESENILLEDCLKRTIEGLEMEILKSEAVIEANFEVAPSVFFPHKYLYSIFHNLVSNALKYQSPDRKPIIKLKTKKINENIIFSVKDNGLGIDMVKNKHNFFKIGKVFHRHPNAKGFGLYMTKTQVDAMGGRIWVESIPNEGSTFFIEFKNQN
jgi:PAS domain S-box-containing protein